MSSYEFIDFNRQPQPQGNETPPNNSVRTILRIHLKRLCRTTPGGKRLHMDMMPDWSPGRGGLAFSFFFYLDRRVVPIPKRLVTRMGRHE